MTIANVALTNTFDQWRIVTNQMVTLLNDIESSSNLVRAQSNTTPLVVTSSVSRGGTFYFDLSTNSNFTNTSTNVLATSNVVNKLYNETLSIGISGNTYANVIGISGNTYANVIGISGNTYANNIATSVNSYAVAIGSSSNVYSDTVVTSNLATSKSYSDTVVTANLATAKSYSDTVVTANLATSKSYSDTVVTANLATGKTYSDTVVTANLATAKSYSDTVVVANLAIANAYTRTFANTKLANTSGVYFAGDLFFPAGNIGIGRTSSGYKLDVVGSVNASSLLVNGNTVGTVTSVATGTGLTGGTITTSGTISLDTAGAGACTYSSGISSITVDAYGRVTSVSGSAGYVTSGGGLTISNDTSTNGNYYPIITEFATGSITSAKITSTKLYFNPYTGALAATDFNALSDVTLKGDIKQISSPLTIVNNLQGVGFTWKDSGKESYGVIAQEIEKYIPELVVESDNLKSVNYNGIIPFLIEAIKELNAKIEKLEGK